MTWCPETNKYKIMLKQTSLTSLLAFAILSLAGMAQVQGADEKAADVTGTWTWTQAPRAGGNAPANATPRKSTLKLKADGEKLTGTISQPARARRGAAAADAAAAAPAPVETEITDGKVKGNEISFKVKRTFAGNEMIIKYAGKVDGDSIKGKIELPGREGGEPTSRDWEAKRVVAEKK